MLKQLTTCFITLILASSPLAASAQSYLSEADRDYLSKLNESLEENNNPWRSVMSDAEKMTSANYTCTQLDSGRGIESLNREFIGIALGIDDEQVRLRFAEYLGSLQVHAVYSYCPHHLEQLRAYFKIDS